jgi:hypothetical protein
VVFKSKLLTPLGRNRYDDLRKDEVKRVLSPLRQYWGTDEPTKHPERESDPDRPLMSMMAFRNTARRLLMDAGMLRQTTTEE